MKRFLAIALVLSFILALSPLSVFADEYTGTCGEAVTWSLDTETGVLTISGTGDMTDYSTDWEIFTPWNDYNSLITAIIVEEGITSIGNDAFKWCTMAQSAVIPDGVISIGKNAFYNCSSLTDVVIPASVESIGTWAFGECHSIETITVDENNANYKSSENCLIEKETGILLYGSNTSVIPDDGSITAIGDFAFTGQKGLTSITIPDGVTHIGKQAFDRCTNLAEINIAESVKTFDVSSLSDTAITEIEIPDGVTVIPPGLFDGCASLTDVKLPEGIVYIGNGAFEDCDSLVNITLPDSVTSMGSYVFSGCSNLESIKLPDGITYFEWSIFEDCSSLVSVTLPKNLTNLNNYTFKNCNKLQSITIPESVTEINNLAFQNCTSLTSIVLPEGLTTIGNSAFYGCSNLKKVYLPETLTTVGSSAFENCNMLDTVVYAGFEEDWENITVDDDSLENVYQTTKCEHTWGEDIIIAGTCIEEGQIISPCENCEAKHYEYTELDPDNHVWDEGTVTDEPTCTEKGSVHHVCEGCGAECDKETDELGHDDGEWVFNDDGTKERKCTVCGEVLETLSADEYIPNDANGDGKVNMMDYILVKSVCLKGTDDENVYKHCDMTGDGRVNMFDYMAVKTAYFKK